MSSLDKNNPVTADTAESQAPESTRDDLVRNLLDIAASRVKNAKDKGLTWSDPPRWPTPHRHYNDTRQNDCGHDIHVGWLEIGQEAEYAQQLLDFIGVPDGDPQGHGDLDWRVAELVLRFSEARERLGRIADNHRQEQGVGSYCVECQWVWPCPTYRFANGDADTLDPWRNDE